MTKYYAGEKLDSIVWELFLMEKDAAIESNGFTLKDRKRLHEAFSILKNLNFQWKMEGKK